MLAKLKIIFLFLIFGLSIASKCEQKAVEQKNNNKEITKTDPPVSEEKKSKKVIVGAERFDLYLPKIKDLNVALLVNQTSMVGDTHLVDVLLKKGIKIKKIFSPEHGFRGKADAGEKINESKDPKTGIELTSLYGKKRKPAASDLAGIDIVIFDIQDVGVRYYTYIGTMHYVMEACAENNVRFLMLDRPNPNGFYVDGPVLDLKYKSFVGMHRVPIVHGLTVGEYARMINGEGWLANGLKCDLEIIDCVNYDHNTFYELPVKPSPNLPNIRSIYLYPSLCLFEGTCFSIGRGTNKQFQVIGHPDYPNGDFSFTPKPMPGAKNPKLNGKLCHGYDLSNIPLAELRKERKLSFDYLIKTYKDFPDKNNFFLKNNFIYKLSGGDTLKKQIIDGWTMAQIRASWQKELDAFKAMRKKYLLYQDFRF